MMAGMMMNAGAKCRLRGEAGLSCARSSSFLPVHEQISCCLLDYFSLAEITFRTLRPNNCTTSCPGEKRDEESR